MKKDENRIIANINRIFSHLSTIQMMAILFLCGFICMFLVIPTGEFVNSPLQVILVVIGFLFWGSMGIPAIIRKEYPLGGSGLVAVIEGSILVALGLFVAISLFYFRFMK